MTKASSTEWAYFAGIMDGEGTFTIIAAKRQNRKALWYRGVGRSGQGIQLLATLTFAVKGDMLPLWAQQTFGGLVYSRNRGGMWQWRVQRLDQVKDLIGGLLPFLKIKRQQAEVLLRFVQQRQSEELNAGRYHAPYSEGCFVLAHTVRSLNGNSNPILEAV